MNFEVRSSEIENLLRDLGRKISKDMPIGWGFTLFIFSYGPNGSLFYLSSANREDMIETMKEFLRKQGEKI